MVALKMARRLGGRAATFLAPVRQMARFCFVNDLPHTSTGNCSRPSCASATPLRKWPGVSPFTFLPPGAEFLQIVRVDGMQHRVFAIDMALAISAASDSSS